MGDKMQQQPIICMYCKNAYKCSLEIRADETIKWGIFNHTTPINKEEVLFELNDRYKDDEYLKDYIKKYYSSDYKTAKKVLKQVQSSFLI